MLSFICTVRDGDHRWCAHNIILFSWLLLTCYIFFDRVGFKCYWLSSKMMKTHCQMQHSFWYWNKRGLLALQGQNCLGIGVEYHTDKKRKEFVSSTASEEQQQMSEQVHNAKFLCVHADGFTNKSATGAVYLPHTGPNGRPTTAHSLLILLP